METTRRSLLMEIRNFSNSAAWAEFDGLYRPMLLRFAKSRGLSDADAEDVAQHCMAAIRRHIGSFEYDRQRGRFRSWLATLVRNRARNLLSRTRRAAAADEALQRVPDGAPGPAQALDHLWLEECLRQCIARTRDTLGPRDFHAFQRYVVDGQPAAAVCEEFGLKPAQLYKLKWKVTQLLRDEMLIVLEENDAHRA